MATGSIQPSHIMLFICYCTGHPDAYHLSDKERERKEAMKESGKGEEEGVCAEQVIFDVQVVLLTRSSSSSWRSQECNREHRTI